MLPYPSRGVRVSVIQFVSVSQEASVVADFPNRSGHRMEIGRNRKLLSPVWLIPGESKDSGRSLFRRQMEVYNRYGSWIVLMYLTRKYATDVGVGECECWFCWAWKWGVQLQNLPAVGPSGSQFSFKFSGISNFSYVFQLQFKTGTVDWEIIACVDLFVSFHFFKVFCWFSR